MSEISDLRSESLKQFEDQAQKYVYALMTAATAALGFAVNASMGQALSWPSVFLGVAIAGFGASFFYGCRLRSLRLSMISDSIKWIDLLVVDKYKVGETAEEFHAKYTAEMDKSHKKMRLFSLLQEGFLGLGVLSFVIWRIFEMYSLTSKSKCFLWV